MPQRFCQCRGCPSCNTQAGSHGALFSADSTGTLKCPGCQGIATQKRNARAPRASRGYDARHVQVRARLLAQWRPGDPCALCGQPMLDKTRLDLAHNEDRTGWKGLSHRECNRNTSGKR